MELVPIKITHGEETAWQMIADAEPKKITLATLARYDESSGNYTLECFGADFTVNPTKRSIHSDSHFNVHLLQEHADLFRITILWYLANGMDIPESGKLIRPSDIKGGQIFAKGVHVLPLDDVAQRFGSDKERFITSAEALKGVSGTHGDASVVLRPFPRIPVTLVLWLEDEDEGFPPRVDLLLDSTAEMQAPADVIWSASLLTLTTLLSPEAMI